MPLPRRADSPLGFVRFAPRVLRGSISPAAVDSLATAIQNQEGYFPGSVAYQNNNPGNLRYAGQAGASQGSGGFARFDSYDDGVQALKNQITLDATRGTDVNGNPTTTLSELIASWAPSSENDTASYVQSVAAQTGFDPDASLSSLGYDSDFSLDDAGESPAVDLSFLGLPSDVSVPVAVGGGLLALYAFSRLF